MALCTADFELGTQGATIATGDTGSATAWNVVSVPGSGGALIYDNTHAYGIRAAKLTTGSPGTAGTLEWSSGSLGTQTDTYGRLYFYTTANPSSNPVSLVQYRATTTIRCRINIKTDGKIELADSTNFGQFTSTNAIGLNQWVRLEWHFVFSSSVGHMECKLFNNADSSTATETIGNQSTNLPLGGGSANDVQFSWGPNASQIIWFDHILAGASSYPGPVVTGFTNTVAPTVTGNLTVGSTVTANPGTWTPTPSNFNYFWHRADDAVGTNLVEIAGATGATYTLSSADTAKFIQAGVIPL